MIREYQYYLGVEHLDPGLISTNGYASLFKLIYPPGQVLRSRRILQNGHLSILRYIERLDHQAVTLNALSRGHLDIVRWFQDGVEIPLDYIPNVSNPDSVRFIINLNSRTMTSAEIRDKIQVFHEYIFNRYILRLLHQLGYID